jgi:hypothetical protein
MLLRLFFKHFSLPKQIEHLKNKGVMIGTRHKDGRKVYLYMIKDFFVEVFYKSDTPENEAEQVKLIPGLKNLNQYLESEFRATF